MGERHNFEKQWMSQSESAFATRIVCDDFSACFFFVFSLNARWGSAAAGRLLAARSCSLRARAAISFLLARAAIV